MFSSPHGDFSFSIKRESHTIKRTLCFRPLTGISLFLYRSFDTLSCSPYTVFVPSRGFLFFYICHILQCGCPDAVFVPSRGFLFFYTTGSRTRHRTRKGFRPLTGISLFLLVKVSRGQPPDNRFRPLTGISLFLSRALRNIAHIVRAFSSPHGDFSFSIKYCP